MATDTTTPAVPPAAPTLPDFKDPTSAAAATGAVPETLVEKIVYWRDPILSGGIFAGVNVLCFLTLIFKFSFLAVFSFCLLAFLITMFLYQNGTKFLEGHLGKENIPQPDFIPVTPFSAEAITAKVPEATDFLNETASKVRDIALCKDNISTLKAIGGVFGVYIIGRIFPDLVLFYLLFLAIMILPKVYELNKEQIDAKAAEVGAKLSEESAKAMKVANEKTAAFREQASKKISETATPLMQKVQPQLDSIRQRVTKASSSSTSTTTSAATDAAAAAAETMKGK